MLAKIHLQSSTSVTLFAKLNKVYIVCVSILALLT